MAEEFNLSEKEAIGAYSEQFFHIKDVKEFIKRFKERTMGTTKLNPIDASRVCAEIDKLAGDKLNG